MYIIYTYIYIYRPVGAAAPRRGRAGSRGSRAVAAPPNNTHHNNNNKYNTDENNSTTTNNNNNRCSCEQRYH